jgi:CHAT domain-containing protein
MAQAAQAASAPAPPPPAAPRTPRPARPVPPVIPVSRAVLLLGEAEHALKRGDLPAGLDAAARAVALHQETPVEQDMVTGNRFGRVGELLAAAGDWTLARAALEEGLAIKTRHAGKLHRRIAPDLTLLSAAHEKLGDYEAALRFAERDLTIRRLQSNGRPADLAISLGHYGLAALGLEDFDGASAALREALAIGETARADDAWTASMLDHLGLAVARQDADAARALHERAFALRRAMLPASHPDIGRSLLHISAFLLRGGRYENAETHLRGALEIFEAAPHEELFAAQCLEGLSVLCVRRQDVEGGRTILLTAVERLRTKFGPDHRLLLKFETELAFLTLFTGDIAGAAALGKAVLRRARAKKYHALRRDLWFFFSQLAAARGERSAAILFGKLAARVTQSQPGAESRLETPLQKFFGARPGDVFRHLAQLLAKAGRLPETSAVLAMQKQDELFGLLRRAPAMDPRTAQIGLNAAEAEWQANGDAVLRIFDDLAEEVSNAAVDRQLAAAEKKFESWLDSAEAISALPNLPLDASAPGLSSLGARVALLQVVAGPQTLHLLLSTTEFQIGRDVAVTQAALRKHIEAFRAAIATRSDEAEQLAAKLYQWLIAPVMATCRELGLRTLLISAEGPLRYVPFAALHDGTKYLAEFMTTVLFTEAVPEAALVEREKLSMAAFGLTGEAGFAAELQWLAGMAAGAGGMPVETVLDRDFDAIRLRHGIASYRLVHIASPISLDPSAPDSSAIRLGNAGAITLHELAVSDFYLRNTALLALTGCGTDIAGDGVEVEGLGATLRWRGVRYVLASLWRPDRLTPAMLATFYGQIRDGKPASAALNTAQRAVLAGDARDRHPYHWAPFIVMGGLE